MRLSSVRDELFEVVDRRNQQMMPWAPAEGMRTISGQLVEIAITEVQIATQLTSDRWIPDEDAKSLLGDCQSLENLRHQLVIIRNQTLCYLDSLSSEDLNELVDVRTMGLPGVPRAEVFRSLAQHEYYHLGQLISYLWLRGDHPYKW